MRRTLLVLLALLIPAQALAVDKESRANAFVAAVNAADIKAYEKFYREHRVTELTDEGRESYARIIEMVGQLDVHDIMGAPDKLIFVCEGTLASEPVSIDFTFESAEPYRIDSISLKLGGEGGPSRQPLAGPGIAPDQSPSELAAALQPWLEGLAEDEIFSGVLVLTRDGEVVYEGAFGLMERSLGIENTLDTRFRVGSITKSFVQVAAAKLVELGKLDPHAQLKDLLPDYPRLDIAGEITVDQLLNQTSGLGGMGYRKYLNSHAPDIRRPFDYFQFFADEPLLFEPGKGKQYSNAGYIVLGAVLEAAAGKPWEAVIEEYVFEPAGMTYSCFVDLDRPHVPIAIGYWHCDPNDPEVWCVNTPRMELVATGGGGSYSSAMDLVNYERALRGGKLLGPGYTRWYFTGEWPTGEAVATPDEWPMSAIAGGAEGVSAVLVANSRWMLSVVGNLDGGSAERLGVAVAEELGLMGAGE